ncbi:MAG: hypothetical protein SFV53_05060 [Rickettsiales bacterium]|nr:hypothetical protein [Rickettsiales bacterium]
MNFSVNFAKILKYKFLLLTGLFTAIFSCSNENNINENFNEKYGEQIIEIKAGRLAPKTELKDKINFSAPIAQEQRIYTNSHAPEIPEYYSTQQFANQIPASAVFTSSAEMFENNYNFPISVPFKQIGAEFDNIEVPSQDAYGIKAAMSDKEYLLISRKLLQKNIDNINAAKSSQDIENSQTLIFEQKKLKQKLQTIKIFGSDSLFDQTNKNDAEDKKIKKTDKLLDKNKTNLPKAVILPDNSAKTVTNPNPPIAVPAPVVAPINPPVTLPNNSTNNLPVAIPLPNVPPKTN